MNWQNKTIWTGDNLPILRGMNSESVDLIYLDPPFNSNANYAAPIGSQAAGAEFKDTWTLDEINLAWHGLIQHEHPGLYAMLTAVRVLHGESMMAYLIYMIPRLMELHRVLKSTGSLYLHCDPTASHYLKMTLDALFGRQNFRNEISWVYSKWTNSARQFQRNHDIILFYSKAATSYRFNKLYQMTEGKARSLSRGWGTNVVQGVRQLIVYDREKARERIALGKHDRIVYHDEAPAGVMMSDWWNLPYLGSGSKERTGYPTQKPLALLRRIILASSNEGDMVLDPFCGCATACVAAQKEKRQWTGIDISPKAAELMLKRCHDDLGLESVGIIHREDILQRTDLGNILPYNAIENKNRLFGEQDGHCNACGVRFYKANLTVDHIVARSKGGTDHISNLQLLCGSCNSIKGDRSHAWLLARLLDKGYIRKQAARR